MMNGFMNAKDQSKLDESMISNNFNTTTQSNLRSQRDMFRDPNYSKYSHRFIHTNESNSQQG